MGNLAQRMHAGVGAAGPVHHDILLAKPRQRLLKRALHGKLAVLALPAGERRAVIFDGQPEARHDRLFHHAARFGLQAIEKGVKVHRTLAFSLQADRPDGTGGAGNRHARIQHRAG